MKNWFSILFAVVVLTITAQNQQPKELGVGFVIPSNPYTYEDLSTPDNLYADKELKTKWTSDSVFPFFLKPDYGLYHFICLEKMENSYKVLVNDNDVGYVVNDTNYHFQAWDSILLSSKVERITLNNPIQKDCSIQSDTLPYPCKYERLKVEEVVRKEKEYWVKISFTPNCETYRTGKSIVQYGWIKWRDGDKLLVVIMLLC